MDTQRFAEGSIDAILFDVIGTLVDEDATFAEAAAHVASETGLRSADDLRSRWVHLLDEQMSAVVEGTNPWQPHRELVRDCASQAIAELGGTMTPSALELISTLDRRYQAWPDAAAATAVLRRDRLVAGLSNGDLDSLAHLANANDISWDVALSTAAVHTFKPADAAYRYSIEALRLDVERTLFVAAHPWDLRAAAAHGFRTAYIARPGAERPSADDNFDLATADLADLARILA